GSPKRSTGRSALNCYGICSSSRWCGKSSALWSTDREFRKAIQLLLRSAHSMTQYLDAFDGNPEVGRRHNVSSGAFVAAALSESAPIVRRQSANELNQRRAAISYISILRRD
uniref:Uncharacterized protein n=2 Tax=Parascaris univalens TaxID=6257 RepID=A0A915AP69_PARUN